MDIKKYLLEEIKKCRRKINLAKLIDCGILFAAAGGIVGMFCELASLIWPFYYAHLAAGLCFAAGFLTGTGYAIYKRADMKQAAGRLDSFGLKERMITAYELMAQENVSENACENEFVQMQRQDALLHYNQVRNQIKIPVFPDKRHVLALVLLVVAVIGMSLLPSSVRERAQTQHQVQEQAKEEQEKLEELLEALEGVDMESLTEEQKLQLKELAEMMNLSQEELARADSWESLASAAERLDYKYEQAAQSLENLAGQLDDPAAAGVASAEAMAKAMANQNGQQMASSGTAASSGTQGSGSGDNSGNSKEGSGENDGSGDGSGQGEDGNGNGNSGNGSGDGSGGSGSGNGQGEGNGSGQGEGTGSGNGGDGSGIGAGRGTGSSDAVHDYVSIPNAVADDSSLTGNKNGDQDSDYYRQQNGLAWEGNHVDYNSVIGEYTDNAYEGIANGRYPSGMESVIRDYFENLNK